MMSRILFSLIAVFVGGAVSDAQATVRVVASSTNLASITKFVGGDLVEVSSIARGTADPHFVEVLPSYMIKVKRAQLYLKVGLDLDRWADKIIDGSRNGKLLIVDCSQGIVPLNVPVGGVDASMGDIHPGGNPHYWLDPRNGEIMAATIRDALSRLDPEHAEEYRAGQERFVSLLRAKEREWALVTERLRGMEIVTYHDTWPYFSRAFGVSVAGFVEPKPGIEPTPSHTANLVELINARGIQVIGLEPYYSTRTPDSIANATGARVVVLPPSVNGADGADDYLTLFDVLLRTLVSAGAEQ